MNAQTKVMSSVFAWLAVATGVILLVPLIAMQFTNEVNWTTSDFVLMGLLLFGASSLFVLVSRRLPTKHRTLAGLLFAAGFCYLWAELAVGVFTTLGS